MSDTKVCKFCGRELPREAFNKSSKAKDGLQIYCRECQAELNKEYNKAHPNRKTERRNAQSALDSAPQPEPTTTAEVIRTSDGRTLRRVSESCKPLEEFSSRDLLTELKRRGYVWADMWVKTKIEYTKI